MFSFLIKTTNYRTTKKKLTLGCRLVGRLPQMKKNRNQCDDIGTSYKNILKTEHDHFEYTGVLHHIQRIHVDGNLPITRLLRKPGPHRGENLLKDLRRPGLDKQ